MIHPHTELRFISKEIGYGVFATRLIPKGTITWAYDLLDRSFSPREVSQMDYVYKNVLDKYSYRENNGNFILCWDNARIVNHSFQPSCITTAYNFELAIKDIYPGEELTDDYGYLNCMEPFDCIPEPGTSRVRVMPDDLLYFYKEWDVKLLSAFECFTKVDQPLHLLIEPQYGEKVTNIANGREAMDSILNVFYNENQDLMKKKDALLRHYSPSQLKEGVINKKEELQFLIQGS